jgi:hypothetical protein
MLVIGQGNEVEVRREGIHWVKSSKVAERLEVD